jgi:hypothetical protein
VAKSGAKRTASAPETEWLALAEIYEHVHRQNPLVPPERIKADIIKAWRDGHLPLIASEERAYRNASPLKPLVWFTRPEPDSHDIEVVAGVVFVIPRRELGPRDIYLPELPGFPPTAVKGPVRGKCLPDLSAPRDPKEPTEKLKDQPIPANISLADIEFCWHTSGANWHDKATGAITDFRGIRGRLTAVERQWPPATAQSTQRWVMAELQRMRNDGEVQPGIKRAALARKLKPRLDAAAKAGLVEHTMKQKPLEQALKHWGFWPVE